MERTNRKTKATSIMVAVIVLAIAFMALFALSPAITAKATPTVYEGGATLNLDDLRVGDVISGAYGTVTGQTITNVRLSAGRYSCGAQPITTLPSDWGPINTGEAETSLVNNDGMVCFHSNYSFDFYPLTENGELGTAWVVTEIKDGAVYFGGKGRETIALTYLNELNNAVVTWESGNGSWKIDGYDLVGDYDSVRLKGTFSGETAAGEYGYDTLVAEECYVTHKTRGTIDLLVTEFDGRSAVAINGGVVSVTGTFMGDDGNVYSLVLATSGSGTLNPIELTYSSENEGDDVNWCDDIDEYGAWAIYAGDFDYQVTFEAYASSVVGASYWENLSLNHLIFDISTHNSVELIGGHCMISEVEGGILFEGIFISDDAAIYFVNITYIAPGSGEQPSYDSLTVTLSETYLNSLWGGTSDEPLEFPTDDALSITPAFPYIVDDSQEYAWANYSAEYPEDNRKESVTLYIRCDVGDNASTLQALFEKGENLAVTLNGSQRKSYDDRDSSSGSTRYYYHDYICDFGAISINYVDRESEKDHYALFITIYGDGQGGGQSSGEQPSYDSLEVTLSEDYLAEVPWGIDKYSEDLRFPTQELTIAPGIPYAENSYARWYSADLPRPEMVLICLKEDSENRAVWQTLFDMGEDLRITFNGEELEYNNQTPNYLHEYGSSCGGVAFFYENDTYSLQISIPRDGSQGQGGGQSAEPLVQVDGQTYTDIKEAVEACNWAQDKTITLLRDLDISGNGWDWLVIETDLTIDVNGHLFITSKNGASDCSFAVRADVIVTNSHPDTGGMLGMWGTATRVNSYSRYGCVIYKDCRTSRSKYEVDGEDWSATVADGYESLGIAKTSEYYEQGFRTLVRPISMEGKHTTHSYNDNEWYSNDTLHWRGCAYDNCDAVYVFKSDSPDKCDEHIYHFGNDIDSESFYTCQVCGYVDSERKAAAEQNGNEQQNVPEGVELWVAGVDILAAGTVSADNAIGVSGGTATARYNEELYAFILTLENFEYSGDGCDGSVIYFKGTDNDGCNRLLIQVLGENSFYSSSHIAAGMITLATPHAQLFIDGAVGNGTGSLSLRGNHFGILTAGGNTSIGVYEVTLLIESDVYAINMTGTTETADCVEVTADSTIAFSGNTRAVFGGCLDIYGGQAWDGPQNDPVELESKIYEAGELSSYVKIAATRTQSGQSGNVKYFLDLEQGDVIPAGTTLMYNEEGSQSFTVYVDDGNEMGWEQVVSAQEYFREPLNYEVTDIDYQSRELWLVVTEQGEQQNYPEGVELWVAGVDILAAGTVSADNAIGVSGGTATVQYDPEEGRCLLTLDGFVYSGTGYNGADERYHGSAIYFKGNADEEGWCNRLSIILRGENSLTSSSVNNTGMISFGTAGTYFLIECRRGTTGSLSLGGNYFGILTAGGGTFIGVNAGTLNVDAKVCAVKMSGDNDFMDVDRRANATLYGITQAIDGGYLTLGNGGQAWTTPQNSDSLDSQTHASGDLSSYFKIVATSSLWEDVVYLIGSTFTVEEGTWVVLDTNTTAQIDAGEYTVPEPDAYGGTCQFPGQFQISGSPQNLSMTYNGGQVTGFVCTGGDGSEGNPYTFAAYNGANNNDPELRLVEITDALTATWPNDDESLSADDLPNFEAVDADRIPALVTSTEAFPTQGGVYVFFAFDGAQTRYAYYNNGNYVGASSDYFTHSNTVTTLINDVRIFYVSNAQGGQGGGHGSEEEGHEHDYSEEWNSDETVHWHACTGDGDCDAPKKDEAAHTYGEDIGVTDYYICSVCGYEHPSRKQEYTEAQPPAVVKQIAVNEVYYFGEGIELSDNVWVLYMNGDPNENLYRTANVRAGTYKVGSAYTWSQWMFHFLDLFTYASSGAKLTLSIVSTYDPTYYDNVAGFRCVGGTGTEADPYTFAVVFDFDEPQPAHTHDYETVWTTDDVGHWHACIGDGECDAPYGDYGEHSYSDDVSDVAYYTCADCQYENATRKSIYEAAPQPAAHTHDNVTFEKAWTSTTSLPTEAGNYYLTADVTLSSSWNVPAGETYLCLNGHGIKVTGVDSVIYIASGRTLNVYDCGDTVHYFDRDGTNRFAININETEGSGRNSFVGGYIAGGKGKDNQTHGGGVYVNGTFNLYGGNIIGNTLTASDNCGAGVYCNENSIFRMYGGSISYNYAQNAGCAIFGWKNCSIEIHGGEISYNKTNWSSGSAISFWNPADGGYTVSLKLYGGFIHDNSSHGGEGAVNLVTASPTVGLKGGLIVQDNTTDSTAGNAALNVCVGTKPINIEGALSSDAKICIRLSSGTGVFTSGWSTWMGSADPKDYFVSENGDYQVYLLDGEAAILDEDPNAPAVTLGEGLLYVGGVDIVTAENYTVNGTGGGTAVLSETDGKLFLTLTDYVYEGPGYSDGYEGGAIDFRTGYENGLDLTIVLVGNNTITKKDDSGINLSHGIYYAGYDHSLIIDGEGTLTISFASDRSGCFKSNGIFLEPGIFVMNGGTVLSNGGTGSEESLGIYSSQRIIFNGGSFTGNGYTTYDWHSFGIYCSNITVNGGTVSASSPLENGEDDSSAFQNSSLTINAGTVIAYGKNSFSSTYNLKCGTNSTWSIFAGEDEASATEVSSINGNSKYVRIVAQSASVHTHDYSTEWTQGETTHWHACTGDGDCDAPKKDEAAHVYGDDVSETSYYVCSVCGYENEARKAEYESNQGSAVPVTLGTGLLYVGGVDIVTAENYTVNGTGGGTAVLSEDEQGNLILTLTNYVYTGAGYDSYQGGAIDYHPGYSDCRDLTILLVGENSITKSNDNMGCSYGIYFKSSEHTLIIDGTGSLTISFDDSNRAGQNTKSNGIFCEPGAFVMNGGSVVSNGGRAVNESAGIYAANGITFNGGSFTGNGYYTTNYQSRGIYASRITINGGTVIGTAPLDNPKDARAFDNSTLTINAGTVTAYGNPSFSSTYNLKCGTNSTWSIFAGEDEASATEVSSINGNSKYVHIVAQSAGAHAHDYETAWTTNDVGHWHACVGDGECDAPYGDYGEHSYSDDVSDVAYYTCADCQYVSAYRKSIYEAAQQPPVIYVASVTKGDVTTEYTSLIEAYEACPEGGTIVLIADVDISNSGDEVYVTVEKDLNIDLHGHTLKFKYTPTSAQIILSGGHVLTIDNSVPEKGGVKGFIDVADDGSYVLLRNCRLIFGKTALASSADINHIEPFFTVENIDEDGFLSLIRPMTDDELVELTEELIDEIPDPPVNNDETKDAIDEARKVYDMLPEDKKEEVENRQKLFDAEDEYARMNNAKWSIKIRAKSTSSVDYTAYIDEGEKIVRVYDVTLYRIAVEGGEEQDPVPAQPSDIGDGATITVKLTIPNTLLGKNFRILHVHSAEEYGFVDFTTDADGKHVTIRGVDKLSDFAFVVQESELNPSGQGSEQGSGEQGPGEQGQGGQEGQGSVDPTDPTGTGEPEPKPFEAEPEITKEDDPTIDNWTLTPKERQGQGVGGQSGQGGSSQGTSQGGQGGSEQGGQGGEGQSPAPAVTVALEDTEPQEGLSVEVEVKTEVSEEVAKSDKGVFMASLQKDDEIAVVYEVKLIRTTIEGDLEIREEIQPSDIKEGMIVVINMLIPEELRGKPFKLVHIHSEDDVKEVLDYTISEDGTTVTVRVDRLSEFAFIGKAATDEVIVEPNKLSNGAIAGIVIGGSFGILFLGLLVLFLLKREKKSADEEPASEKAPKATKKAETKKTATKKAAAIAVAAAVLPKEAVGFYRITEKGDKYAFALFYEEGDALSKEMGGFESEEGALAAIRAIRAKGDGIQTENRIRNGEESIPAPKFVLDVTEKGVYYYALIDADGEVLLQSVQYLNEKRCAEDLKKTILCVTTDEIVDPTGAKKKDASAETPAPEAQAVEQSAEEAEAPAEEATAAEEAQDIAEEVAADALVAESEEAPTEEIPEEESAEAEEKPQAGVSLRENLETAKATLSHSGVNKQYVADYLRRKYDSGVDCRQRVNETKTGLPLADTHYAVGEKNVCFTYVYEVGETTMLLVKVTEEYGAELAKKHPIVKRSAFPRSKSAWYSVIVDESFTAEEIEKILDDAYLMNGGVKAADEGISLKETLARAKATRALVVRSKKGIADHLAKEYGDKAELNLRGNKTKTGLPLADTHYALSETGKKCFLYVYETEGVVVLLARLPEAYADTLRKEGGKIMRSAFPKSKDAWYTVILDDDCSDKDLESILRAAYDWAK